MMTVYPWGLYLQYVTSHKLQVLIQTHAYSKDQSQILYTDSEAITGEEAIPVHKAPPVETAEAETDQIKEAKTTEKLCLQYQGHISSREWEKGIKGKSL